MIEVIAVCDYCKSRTGISPESTHDHTSVPASWGWYVHDGKDLCNEVCLAYYLMKKHNIGVKEVERG